MGRQTLRAAAAGAGALAFLAGLAGGAQAHHISGGDAQQVRPELGTSGSSREHLVIKNRLYCYAGTMGALVTDGSVTYVLSNNHVLAKENEQLNQGTGADGDIIQPGLLDLGTCTAGLGETSPLAATLSDYVPIAFGKGRNMPENEIDAAIAQVVSGIDASGAILGIGPLSGNVITPAGAAGRAVQKTGRTTGHTFGVVQAINVTVDVKYESGTARFVNQLRIRHVCDANDFSTSGDSGSQIVTVPAAGDPSEDPDSVGLLFAGGDVDTFANPMASVAGSSLGVTPVGAPDGPTAGSMAADFGGVAANCPSTGGGGGPGGGRGGGPPFGAIDRAGLAIASDVKARNSDAIFALPDVVGHGIGFAANGTPVIEVYVSSRARRAASRPVPASVEGIPVRVVETGEVHAF